MKYPGLTFESDQRRDPDEDDNKYRLGSFKRGWRAALEGRDYDDALQNLKWDNLGWRLANIFGESEEEQIEDLFEWCVKQMQERSK